MAIYIVIFFFLLLLSPINKQKVGLSFWLIMIGLILFAGFRGEDVGVDTIHYKSIFNVISESGSSWVELGWTLLNKFVIWAGGDFVWLLLITAVLTLFPVFLVARYESPWPILSIFIYFALHFYCGSFNIMRQYLSCSLLLLAYWMYGKKERIVTLLVLIISFLIHHSSLFAILIFFLPSINFTKRRVLVLTVLSLVMGFFMTEDLIARITFSEYSNIAYVRDSFGSAFLNIVLWDSLMLLIVFTMTDDLLNSHWGKMVVLSILFFTMTFTLKYGARAYIIFGIAQVIVLPKYIKENVFEERLWSVLIVLAYTSFQFFRMLFLNANEIIPYTTSFSQW